MATSDDHQKRPRWQSPWVLSPAALTVTLLGLVAAFLMWESFTTRQLDTKGCEMSYMRPIYHKFDNFDTEYTRFASKYALYLYREGEIDEDIRVKGVPVLFIPGNAGSYKQVRSLGAEAAYHYHNTYGYDARLNRPSKRALDFFSVDFNEDFTAFHGQTLLDQAEYLNDAIAFILSLYHTPAQSMRDPHLPDPASVIIVGHSMGGFVARTMFTMPNYPSNTINTIITLAAPHARAPVSFDGNIVRTYKGVNEYWRQAYSLSGVDNPLRHVTLVSIAGGGLDTIVPSDYASTASVMPESHGFTVFASTVPNVWTGMDHLAITWCDQMRKSVVRALYEVIDVTSPTQTTSRADRMRSFKKWFLTGLEDTVEKILPLHESEVMLTLEERSTVVRDTAEFELYKSGQATGNPKVHLLQIPTINTSEAHTFRLLTNQRWDVSREEATLEVLICNLSTPRAEPLTRLFSNLTEDPPDEINPPKIICKTTVRDVVTLPGSTKQSSQPFQTDQQPFSYLEYDLETLSSFQFVVIVDTTAAESDAWAYAEFRPASMGIYSMATGLPRLLATGLTIKVPHGRPITTQIAIPAIGTSLLAYDVRIDRLEIDDTEYFRPLLRQYISNVYESKFFVNAKEAKINIHGVAPYVPAPVFEQHAGTRGLAFQLWVDPAWGGNIIIHIRIDVLGSLGKLWMRYRILFATFPLLLVALILRQQFRIYDDSGVFIPFFESLTLCVKTSIPAAFAALVILSIGLPGAQTYLQPAAQSESGGHPISVYHTSDHETLLGANDPILGLLVPLFGIICLATCVVFNYIVLGLVHLFAFAAGALVRSGRATMAQHTAANYAVSGPRRRVVTTCILLSLVSTVIPYHFAYVVLCVVQLVTCVRGCKLARDPRSEADRNFYNYTHSVLILMLWILPINLAVLIVWIRNLSIHWLTPFSTHHNVLAIMPCILLVETISLGHMIPRVQSGLTFITGGFLFSIGAYAAMYGVSYAYVLPHLVNILYAWLVVLHLDFGSNSSNRLGNGVEDAGLPAEGMKKRP